MRRFANYPFAVRMVLLPGHAPFIFVRVTATYSLLEPGAVATSRNLFIPGISRQMHSLPLCL